MFDGKVGSARQVSIGGRKGGRAEKKSVKDFVNDTRKQREARALDRLRNQSAVKIQSKVRQIVAKYRLHQLLRERFDSIVENIAHERTQLQLKTIDEAVKLILVFFHRSQDLERLAAVFDKIAQTNLECSGEYNASYLSINNIDLNVPLYEDPNKRLLHLCRLSGLAICCLEMLLLPKLTNNQDLPNQFQAQLLGHLQNIFSNKDHRKTFPLLHQASSPISTVAAPGQLLVRIIALLLTDVACVSLRRLLASSVSRFAATFPPCPLPQSSQQLEFQPQRSNRDKLQPAIAGAGVGAGVAVGAVAGSREEFISLLLHIASIAIRPASHTTTGADAVPSSLSEPTVNELMNLPTGTLNQIYKLREVSNITRALSLALQLWCASVKCLRACYYSVTLYLW